MTTVQEKYQPLIELVETNDNLLIAFQKLLDYLLITGSLNHEDFNQFDIGNSSYCLILLRNALQECQTFNL